MCCFNACNAYKFIQKQISFGPRIPGSISQRETAYWLESTLEKYADRVIVQNTVITLGDGKSKVPCYNIIGIFNPDKCDRVLLVAHWDTRPLYLDGKSENMDGADDGASGVGILLEIARVIHCCPIDIGVDILLVDVEDSGTPAWGAESYALGSLYWAKNPHIKNYTANAGILLDMVGGKNAEFYLEKNSMKYACPLMKYIWSIANNLGYGEYFIKEPAGAIYDDHVPINVYRKIPTIDIINLPNDDFPYYWHTENDNICIIDVNTLNAVGKTVLKFLYSSKKFFKNTHQPN